MAEECCPECGHMLSRARTTCQFCSWSDDFNRLEDEIDAVDGETVDPSVKLDELAPDSLLK